MNHHEHELHEKNCCGGVCGSEEVSVSTNKAAEVLKWIFLWGAFLCSLLTLIMLPKIVRKEIIADQALKAWGIENYEKLNREIYESPEYKERMKAEVDNFIQQSKVQMEMMKQQEQQPQDSSLMMPSEGEAVQTNDAAQTDAASTTEQAPSVEVTQ